MSVFMALQPTRGQNWGEPMGGKDQEAIGKVTGDVIRVYAGLLSGVKDYVDFLFSLRMVFLGILSR